MTRWRKDYSQSSSFFVQLWLRADNEVVQKLSLPIRVNMEKKDIVYMTLNLIFDASQSHYRDQQAEICIRLYQLSWHNTATLVAI